MSNIRGANVEFCLAQRISAVLKKEHYLLTFKKLEISHNESGVPPKV